MERTVIIEIPFIEKGRPRVVLDHGISGCRDGQNYRQKGSQEREGCRGSHDDGYCTRE